jgi:hypothetical protein
MCVDYKRMGENEIVDTSKGFGWHVPERSEGRGVRENHALRKASGRATQFARNSQDSRTAVWTITLPLGPAFPFRPVSNRGRP